MKKIVIVVIVMVIAIGLFGCSSAGSGNTPSTPTKLSISLSENSATLAASGTLKLSATESSGTVPIVWSSQNDSVATVNQEGVVDANGPGTTNIVTTIQGTNVTATCSVVVTGVAQITLSQNDISAFVSATPVQLTETTVKTGGITWATDNAAVATVNSTGLVTFGASGTAIITATQTLTGATATCSVTVAQPVLSLSKTLQFGYVGQKGIQLTATSTVAGPITWATSNSNILNVDNNGNIAFVNSGTATITAAQVITGATANCKVIVVQYPVNMSQTTMTGYVNGPTAQISAGSPLAGSISFLSSNPKVIIVDQNGTVHFVGAGTANIIATQSPSGLTGTCSVTVKQATLSLNTVTLTGFPSPTPSQLTTTASDPGPVTWSSSNTVVATVSSTGSVIFVSAGTATITATQKITGATATCAVTVVPPPTLTLSQTNIVEYVGKQYINTVAQPSQSGPITWTSSNTQVVTVSGDNTGNLWFLKAGTATITATQASTKLTATCAVTVVSQETITASPSSIVGVSGSTQSVTFTSNCTWSNMGWADYANYTTATTVSRTDNSVTIQMKLNTAGQGGTLNIDNSNWFGGQFSIPVTVTSS